MLYVTLLFFILPISILDIAHRSAAGPVLVPAGIVHRCIGSMLPRGPTVAAVWYP